MQSEMWNVQSKAAYEIWPELSLGSDLQPVWLCPASHTIFVNLFASHTIFVPKVAFYLLQLHISHNICNLFAPHTLFVTKSETYLLHTQYLYQSLQNNCFKHNIYHDMCNVFASHTIFFPIFAIYLLHTQYLSQNLQYICFIHNICHNMWLYLSRFLKEFGQCWSQRRQIWKYEPHIYISKHEKSCSTWLVIFWTARNYIFWWQNCICWWKICIFLWIEIEPRSLSVKEKTTKVR